VVATGDFTLTLDESTIEALTHLSQGPRRLSLYLTGVIHDLAGGYQLVKPPADGADSPGQGNGSNQTGKLS